MIFRRARGGICSKSWPLSASHPRALCPERQLTPLPQASQRFFQNRIRPRYRPLRPARYLDGYDRPRAGRQSQRSDFSGQAKARLSLNSFQFRIQRVAQRITEYIDRENRHENRNSGHGHNPPGVIHIIARAREHQAPLGERRLHADAKKTQRGASQTAVEKPSVACTINGAAQLGSTCENISRRVPAPATRDAITYSFCSSPSAEPRTSRT